jgi:2-polyprenyl-3-methyl-5-hydroxy-6-metoxy-1,4-benzoquinol methylase
VGSRPQKPPNDYRSVLFDNYDRWTSILKPDEDERLAWFRTYVDANYLPLLGSVDRTRGEVLDVGCHRGHMLAALASAGFQRLAGVDLSRNDVEVARRIVPAAEVVCADVRDYLASRERTFDVIIAKAVLEHVRKDEVLPFLRTIESGLKAGGVALLDVPNMDWLFASHERYLDFTHEVGFTKASLQQVVETVFADVVVRPIDNVPPSHRFSPRGIARSLIGLLLRSADPEGGSGDLWCRSLVAIGHVM